MLYQIFYGKSKQDKGRDCTWDSCWADISHYIPETSALWKPPRWPTDWAANYFLGLSFCFLLQNKKQCVCTCKCSTLSIMLCNIKYHLLENITGNRAVLLSWKKKRLKWSVWFHSFKMMIGRHIKAITLHIKYEIVLWAPLFGVSVFHRSQMTVFFFNYKIGTNNFKKSSNSGV